MTGAIRAALDFCGPYKLYHKYCILPLLFQGFAQYDTRQIEKYGKISG